LSWKEEKNALLSESHASQLRRNEEIGRQGYIKRKTRIKSEKGTAPFTRTSLTSQFSKNQERCAQGKGEIKLSQRREENELPWKTARTSAWGDDTESLKEGGGKAMLGREVATIEEKKRRGRVYSVSKEKGCRRSFIPGKALTHKAVWKKE